MAARARKRTSRISQRRAGAASIVAAPGIQQPPCMIEAILSRILPLGKWKLSGLNRSPVQSTMPLGQG